MHDIFYSVNNKKFYNTYLAHHESFKTGHKVSFNVEPTAYDAINWLVEPTQSMDTLMDQHAHNLRNKYDVLVMHWSGGTDSHTIYNVFKRNNIHIDEIRVITGNEHTPKFPQFFFDWIKQNHYDATTEITKIDVLDAHSKQSIIGQSDWIFSNVCFMPVFAYSSFEPSDIDRNNEKYAGRKWCMISGHEKPDLVFLKNTWYTRFEDRSMRQAMNPCVENFFLDPMIHLKQSHLLKNAVKQLGVNTIKDGTRAVDFYNITSTVTSNFDYQAHAMACGRHVELVPGHSNLQKKITKAQINDFNLDSGGNLNFGDQFKDVLLVEKLKDNHHMATKYLQGLQSLYAEKDFMDHLFYSDKITDYNNPLTIKPVFSKPYNIGN